MFARFSSLSIVHKQLIVTVAGIGAECDYRGRPRR
jgi:hypothetical protein